jgi:hypothetical protein
VVKWDGFNPRFAGDNYKRPYNISPVETNRQFPLYFPELVDFIDANFRTIADRDHRATAGLSMGGFMSFWIAGKYPHLVSSASNFMGSPEFFVGPRDFPVEYRHDEMYGNYEGVRTRLVTGARDFIQFYHRQMNAIWKYARDWHETEDFDFDHGTPGMAKTLEFHMNAFAHPAAASHGLEPCRCVSELHGLGLGSGIGPQAAGLHGARMSRPRASARRCANGCRAAPRFRA